MHPESDMRYRLAQETDLPACLELLDRNGRCRLSHRVREHLPSLWTEWLAQDRRAPKSFVLWEDLSTPHAPRLEAIGTAHFVRDEVYDLLMSMPQPYLIDRLYGMVLDGHAPFLDQRQIARANAGDGLSLLMSLYLQREHALDHPDSQRLRPLGAAAWYYCHAGYNVRRLLSEVYGRPGGAYMAAGGFELAHVFEAGPEMPFDSEPHQLVLDRANQPPRAMQPMSLWLLHPPPPVMGLPPSQQTIALYALQGDTDRAIAARLGISADAVKQAWRGILRTVSTHLPDLCSDTTDATAHGAAPVRGAEHRRIVVEYLRQHMEELRPWSPAPAPAPPPPAQARAAIASRAHATMKKP
jgi:DNA-binding CsgD family transcriptional regulator